MGGAKVSYLSDYVEVLLTLWRAHVCSSPMPKPYECIKCRQGFRRSTSALRHPGLCRFNIAPSRTNTANHDLQKTRTACFCGHCNGIFLNPSRLQGHVWGHCDETRVQCCGRHFVDVRRLRAHQQENGCAEVDLNRPPRMFINLKIFGCWVDRCGLRFPDVKKLRQVTLSIVVKHYNANNIKESYVHTSQLSFLWP